jgi:predicted CoA-binding protein
VGADAWNVPRYLERAGYTVRAVNPKLASWGDAPAWPTLAALPERVDLIDVFRAEAHLPGHVDEILAAAVASRVRLVPARHPSRRCAARLEAAGSRSSRTAAR